MDSFDTPRRREACPRRRWRLTPGARAGFAVLAIASGLACEPSTPETAIGPNLLLITTDDMGVEVGAYGDGEASTPHIDRLAQSGLRFERAFAVSSTCSPSRSTILTGIHPHSNGHWGFPRYVRLHEGIRTLPDYLGSAGYFTGMIGKFMVRGSEGQFPFDVYERVYPLEGGEPALMRELTANFFEEAGERRFFLMVNTHAPHKKGFDWAAFESRGHDPARIHVPPTNLDTPAIRSHLAGMYDAYSEADDVVAAILEGLAAAGHAESTLVVLISDHGPAVPAGKGALYDAGIHIPMIMRWPGVIQPGRVTNALASTIDLLPTFLAVAGLDPDPDVQGLSMLGLMAGEEDSVRSATVAGNTLLQGNRYFPQRSLRTARFKYIRNLRPDIEFRNNAIETWGLPMMVAWDSDPQARFLLERNVRHPREELYDLEADPYELENLVGREEYADTLSRLRSQLKQRLVDSGDPWVGLWSHDGSAPDPFEPETTRHGPFEPKWLDAMLRDPRLQARYLRRFPSP